MNRVLKTTKTPSTIETLTRDLCGLGIEGVVLVHSSLSQVGWVCGGAIAMIEALTRSLGPDGTLVMPTHSSDLSDPTQWVNPPAPESWWPLIQEAMPPFDPRNTPSWSMGKIPELFRTQAGVLRSAHPQVSFAARGPQAAGILHEHALDFGLGDRSPLARIYELDGSVLLLGVGHDRNTSLHLAEHRAEYPGKKVITQGAPILIKGRRTWVRFQEILLDEEDFAQLGADYEREGGPVRRGKVGMAEALLIPQRPLVDYGVGWLETHRK